MSESIWPEESKGFCDLHENLMLWYGPPKIGKTTFASQFPKALFLLTEDGAKHVKVKGWRIRNWAEFITKVNTLEANIATCPFQNIIIDTVDNLSDMCMEFVCANLGIKDLTDADWGKGFAAFTREFKKQVNRLVRLGLGVGFISHAEERSVKADSITNPYAPAKADDKGNLDITVPTMEKRVRKYILGLVDMILYMAVRGQGQKIERVIYTKPTLTFEAGDRTGRLPECLPLNFNAFVKAYYGNGNGSARESLIERIDIAEQYLAQNSIDNFDDASGERAKKSRAATIGVEDHHDPDVPEEKLAELLQKYRMKAKNAKKNGTTTNKETEEDAVPSNKTV